jgi:hypothetical protein
VPDPLTPDSDDSGVARRRRVVVGGGGVVLLAALVSGMAMYRSHGDRPPAPLSITWGGSEGHPCCVYDANDHTVVAKIKIEGRPSRPGTVTVTVTAYADENTSEAVGSSSRTVRVEGTEHRSLVFTIPVDKAAHVDEDGVAACRLSVEH